VSNLALTDLLIGIINLQLAPMRKILWSIGLLFLCAPAFCQSKAELVTYSFQGLPKGVAYALELKVDGTINQSKLESAKSWIQSKDFAFTIHTNDNELKIMSGDVSLSGNSLSQLLKQLGIETILFRKEDEVKEVSIDKYLEKNSK
jgi:hypothetical protein